MKLKNHDYFYLVYVSNVPEMLTVAEESAREADQDEEDRLQTAQALLKLDPPHVPHDPPTEAEGTENIDFI